MLNRGFMIGDKGFIFDTWEEAENSPSKYKIKVTE